MNESTSKFRVVAARALAISSALIGSGCGLVMPDKGVDRELGADTAKTVETEMGLVSHERAAALVSALGAKLVSNLQPAAFDYRFAIVDEAASNAFAAPGGYIYVSRGLLSLTMTEDELAGVIAHEIQHVERRHSVKQMQKQRRLGVLALPGRLVAGILSDDLAKLVGAPFELVAANYSRDQETEADALGQALAARSGYDPTALGAILGRMEQFESIGATGTRRSTFFDSHPSTPDRIAHLSKDGASLTMATRAAITADPATFLEQFDGLLLGPDPEAGIVHGTTFLHPGLDLHIEMPADWQVTNTRNYVAAVAPKKDGIAILGVVGEGTAEDLPKLADERAAAIEKEYGVKPVEKKATTSGGVPAHALVITDDSGAEPMHIYFMWIAFEGRILQVIGVSPESHRPLIRESVESVRPLSAEERKSMYATRLRIATAQEGESLTALGSRTGNAWTAAETATANQLDATTPLPTGRKLKIAVRESLDGSR